MLYDYVLAKVRGVPVSLPAAPTRLPFTRKPGSNVEEGGDTHLLSSYMDFLNQLVPSLEVGDRRVVKRGSTLR